ncbi:hypothetical protein ACLOAU_16350 [Niabella sp. CJ426]|uniref:hypothetical protein n=1 Tax=Niabella sp. CJ426 TaxID=3393740 RepID=UPI003D03A9FF
MAKKQKYIRMRAHSFYRLMRAIKNHELENEAIWVGKRAVSDFLTLKSNYKISSESVKDEVKIMVLETAGEADPDPDQLADDTKMSDFGFTNIQHIALTGKLNIVIEDNNPSATPISVNEVKQFETVQDCVDAVLNAIKEIR